MPSLSEKPSMNTNYKAIYFHFKSSFTQLELAERESCCLFAYLSASAPSTYNERKKNTVSFATNFSLVQALHLQVVISFLNHVLYKGTAAIDHFFLDIVCVASSVLYFLI